METSEGHGMPTLSEVLCLDLVATATVSYSAAIAFDTVIILKSTAGVS